MSKAYRLYCKTPEDKRFKPVDWNGGRQVANLIHATIFTEAERDHQERVDLAHPDNSRFEFEFRTGRGW